MNSPKKARKREIITETKTKFGKLIEKKQIYNKWILKIKKNKKYKTRLKIHKIMNRNL